VCRSVFDKAVVKNSTAQADGTLGRVHRREILGFVSDLSKRDAQKLLDERLRPINQGRHRPQSTMILSAFVSEHFEPGVLPTLKFATQQIYSPLLRKHLLPRFGNDRLCDIGRADVQHFVLEKLKRGLSWETADHLRHLLSKVLGTAVAWGHLAENPVRGVKMPERSLKRPRTFLSAEEVRCLLAHLGEPARTIVLLAVLTGLRIGEILALRCGRVNLVAGILTVEERPATRETSAPRRRGRVGGFGGNGGLRRAPNPNRRARAARLLSLKRGFIHHD